MAKGTTIPAAMTPPILDAENSGPSLTTSPMAEVATNAASAHPRIRRVRYTSAATPPISSVPAPSTLASVDSASSSGLARMADWTSTRNGE